MNTKHVFVQWLFKCQTADEAMHATIRVSVPMGIYQYLNTRLHTSFSRACYRYIFSLELVTAYSYRFMSNQTPAIALD